MRRLYFILVVFVLLGCSTVSRKVTYEKNDFKNLAADNSKNSSIFLDKYEYQKALDYLKESLKYNTMVDNVPGIILNYANMGKVYLLKKDYETALKFYNSALEIAERNNNITLDKEKSSVYNGLGEAYLFNNDSTNAEKNFNIALKLNVDDEQRALIETNIGRIYFNNKDYNKALDYFLSSLQIYEKLYNEYKLSSAKNYSFILYFTARSYHRSNRYEKALEYIKKALDIDKLIENSVGIADDYYIMGRIYEKIDIEKSLLAYNKAKSIYRLIDDINQYVILSNAIATILFNRKDFKEFFAIKKEVFLLSKSAEKNNVGKEIALLLNNEEALKILSESEIKEIEEKYKVYLLP